MSRSRARVLAPAEGGHWQPSAHPRRQPRARVVPLLAARTSSTVKALGTPSAPMAFGNAAGRRCPLGLVSSCTASRSEAEDAGTCTPHLVVVVDEAARHRE